MEDVNITPRPQRQQTGRRELQTGINLRVSVQTLDGTLKVRINDKLLEKGLASTLTDRLQLSGNPILMDVILENIEIENNGKTSNFLSFPFDH